METVAVVIGDKMLVIDRAVWSAFLEAASLIVDTGDMYPHLESKLGVDLLDKVKQIKIDLDDQNSSS